MTVIRVFGKALLVTSLLATALAASEGFAQDENPTTPGAIPDPGSYQGSMQIQQQQDQQDQQYRQQQQQQPGWATQQGAAPSYGAAGQRMRARANLSSPGPATGDWQIQLLCPGGGGVREPFVQFHHGRYGRRFEGGMTNISMSIPAPHSAHLRGVIRFDTGETDQVDAMGTDRGGFFAGVGTFGGMGDCRFTAYPR
jgi:hypothetical protein